MGLKIVASLLVMGVCGSTAVDAEAGLFNRRKCRTVCAAPVICNPCTKPVAVVMAAPQADSSEPSIVKRTVNYTVERTIRDENGNERVVSETRSLEVDVPTSASPGVQQLIIDLQIEAARNRGQDVIQDDDIDDLQDQVNTPPGD